MLSLGSPVRTPHIVSVLLLGCSALVGAQETLVVGGAAPLAPNQASGVHASDYVSVGGGTQTTKSDGDFAVYDASNAQTHRFTSVSGMVNFINGPLAVGSTGLLGAERLRVSGGTAPGVPGATDVLMGDGQIKAGGGVTCTTLTTSAGVVMNVTDWNVADSSKTQFMLAAANNPTGNGTTNYHGIHFGHFPGYGGQIAQRNGVWWVRSYDASVWGSWYRLWHANDAPTFAGSGVFGASARVGSERLRISGGSAPAAPSSSDVLVGAGQIRAGSGISCTTLTASGNLTMGTNTAAGTTLAINAAAANPASVQFRSAGANRWNLGRNGTLDFYLAAYDAAQALIDTPITILNAANGLMTLARPVRIAGTATIGDGAQGVVNLLGAGGGTQVGEMNWTFGPTQMGQVKVSRSGNDTTGVMTLGVAQDGVLQSHMTVTGAGNIGLGTSTPTHRLEVAGDAAVLGIVTAKEIKVTTTGADYVFEDGYQLMPLSEVAAYVAREKHLPGMMSAAEMQAGGMPVSEVVTKQLAKIEELTLHAIALQRDNESLRQALAAATAAQAAQLAAIQARLEALERR